MRVAWELGPTPCDERCAQVGAPDYAEETRKEMLAYRAQLLRIAEAEGKPMPEGVRLVIGNFPHDLGTYHELVARFDDDDRVAMEWVAWLEDHLPAEWDEEAKAALENETYREEEGG